MRRQTISLTVLAVLIVAGISLGGQKAKDKEAAPADKKSKRKYKIYTEWPFDAEEAKRRQQETAKSLDIPVVKKLDLDDGVTMKLVLIPAGQFEMGSKFSPQEIENRYGGAADWYDSEQPQHTVKITKPFYMSATEVTIEQYRAFLRDGGDDSGVDWDEDDCPIRKSGTYRLSGNKFGKSDDQPMAAVSWHGADKFCQWLSRKTGKTVRLPTEAQWEYACRAGSTTAYCFGDSERQLAEYAWYEDNAEDAGKDYPQPVGRKKPNDWGLYDMHGNVWDWCRDYYDHEYYEKSPKTDPTGPESGVFRVLRGGSWSYYARVCRSAHRLWTHPTDTRGFRVVLVVSSPQ
ncbi:MAG: formylglycine-generating enzyme family protein [Candidatus Brocadiia bacterium]